MATEALLQSPSDLRFWHSTGIGFLSRERQAKFSPANTSAIPQYLVTDEFFVPLASRPQALDLLRRIAEEVTAEPGTVTFWVLDRGSDDGGLEGFEHNLYVLIRFRSKADYDRYQHEGSPADWAMINRLAKNRRTTTWEEAGIGFLGR